MTTKVLLDTDIGTHIDDALCLTYLLAHPQCELIGITTVTGESRLRARIASAICSHAGKSIPIMAGAECPLLVPSQQPTAGQALALAKWKSADEFLQNAAVPFLREMIRAHPHEIVLLCIGPLTNIGLLLAMDPEIGSLLKALVIMGGCFSNQLAGVGPFELNLQLDPHAAAIVYRHVVPIHRSIGIDVTCATALPAREFLERIQAPRFDPVRDFAALWLEQNREIWFRSEGLVTFHDPLAASIIFDPKICDFVRGTVTMELSPGRSLGLNYFDKDEAGVHEAAASVNSHAFFDHYFSICSE